MTTKQYFLAALALIAPLHAAETNAPAPAIDRVGFPKDYAKNFQLLRTVPRDDGAKLISVYGNTVAASVTNANQLPYPYGSIFVMESATTVKDSTGKPARDPRGELTKNHILGLHVMRREKNFGADYAANRSGEWEFVEFKPDSSYLTPPQKSAACAECHLKAGAAKDFVYHGRF